MFRTVKRCSIFCISTADEFKISATLWQRLTESRRMKKKNLKCSLSFVIFKNSEAYEESPYLAFKDAHHWVNKEWSRGVVGIKCCIFTISIFCKPASRNDGNKPKYNNLRKKKKSKGNYTSVLNCNNILPKVVIHGPRFRCLFFLLCPKKNNFYLKICCRL